MLTSGLTAFWVDVADASDEVLMNGEGVAGKDRGEDNLRGDVGVPKLEGKDNFDSDVTNVFPFTRISSLSDDSGVQRTVGKVIFNGLLLVEFWSSSGSAMFWKERFR